MPPLMSKRIFSLEVSNVVRHQERLMAMVVLAHYVVLL